MLNLNGRVRERYLQMPIRFSFSSSVSAVLAGL